MEAILVAVITTMGVVLAALIQSLRKENKSDHSTVSNSLSRIENKIDGHITDHAKSQVYWRGYPVIFEDDKTLDRDTN